MSTFSSRSLQWQKAQHLSCGHASHGTKAMKAQHISCGHASHRTRAMEAFWPVLFGVACVSWGWQPLPAPRPHPQPFNPAQSAGEETGMIPRAACDPEHVKPRDYDSTSFSDAPQKGSWGDLQNRAPLKIISSASRGDRHCQRPAARPAQHYSSGVGS